MMHDHTDILNTAARTLIWRADVTEDASGRFAWQFEVSPLLDNGVYAAWTAERFPDDQARCDETAQGAMRRGWPGYRQEFRARLSSGEIRWIWEDVKIEPQGPGLWTLTGVCTDITEQKRALAALSQAEQRVRLLLDCAGEGIFGLDAQGRMSFVNAAASRMLGWTADELRGQPMHAVFHHTRPDGTPYPQSECPIFHCLRDGRSYHIQDECFWRKDGTGFPVEYMTTPLIEDARQIGVVVTFRDNTERRRVEAALTEERHLLRSLIDTLPDAVFIKDAQGRFVASNAAHQRMLGVASEMELVGRRISDFFPAEQTRWAEAEDAQVLTSGQLLCDSEHAVGTTLHLTTKVPLTDAAGQVTGLVGISRDVTEERRAARELHTILSSARCAVWRADVAQDGNEQVWALRLSNREAAERLWPVFIPEGCRYEDAWSSSRLPEDARRINENSQRALQSGQPYYTQEYRIALADGSIRWIAEEAQIETQGPGRWIVTGVCTDVTERRQAEQDLEIVSVSAHCLVWQGSVVRQEWGLVWDIRVTNEDTARRWLAIHQEPGEPYLTAWASARPPEDMAACNRVASEAFAAGLSGYQQDYRIRVADGTCRWFWEDVRIEPNGEDCWRVSGVCTDITERKILEQERERALAEALDRADRDPLTGLLNHRAFHERLNAEADRVQREGGALGVAVIDLDNFKFFNDAYGHLTGDAVLMQIADALRSGCRSYDTPARFGGDEFAVLMPVPDVESASVAADRLAERLKGIGFQPPGGDSPIPLTVSLGVAVFPDEGPTRLDVLALADARLIRAKTGGAPEAERAERLRHELTHSVDGFPMLDALVAAVDNKDRYTRRHSEDVLAHCLVIAQRLGLGGDEQRRLQVSALLHDVGKIGIPDAVLRKPGRLTDDEYEAMKQHPVMGAVIVGAVPGLGETLDAIRHHHERWDGGGYPMGLAEERIPLDARIMAVADAYSAMTTDRPYRKGMDSARALSILRDGAGTQWDPVCVQAFLDYHGVGSRHAA